VNSSTRHLLNSIKSNNLFEIEKNLQQYRVNGLVKYDALLSIPYTDRLPGLIEKYGKEKVHAVIVAMLTEWVNSFNVVRPMTPDQIVSCTHEILNSSHEDYLGVEDLIIFFQGAKNGKYGKVYDRIDQQTIFEMMEVYRQQRHEEYFKIKEEKDAQFKALGPSERTVQTDELATSIYNVVGRLSEMKEKLKEQREINRANRL
jgi:hypothetical protein